MYDYLLSDAQFSFGERILGQFLISRLRKGGKWKATNTELSFFVGLSEATVVRALKCLKHHDLIDVEYCPETQIKILSLGPNGWAEVNHTKPIKCA
jgi:DNA-binding MarR family transcriptional regulator